MWIPHEAKIKCVRKDSEDSELSKLKSKLRKEYNDVFKEDLGPEDVMKGELKAELNDSEVTPTHISTPAYVPVHLRKAADKELARCLNAGVLEPCNHYTDWVSRGMFVPKHTKEGEEIKVRLVSDLKDLNKKAQEKPLPKRIIPGSVETTKLKTQVLFCN